MKQNGYTSEMLNEYAILILVVVGIIAILISGNDPTNSAANIQAFAAVILVLITGYYAYSTDKISRDNREIVEITKQNYLKPIVLRSGQIIMKSETDWDGVPSREKLNSDPTISTLVFENHKNIATEITGTITLNKKKYKLVFWNNDALITETGNHIMYHNLQWAWLPPESRIYSAYIEESAVDVNEKNNIDLNYKDIEGNQYQTFETFENGMLKIISKKI